MARKKLGEDADRGNMAVCSAGLREEVGEILALASSGGNDRSRNRSARSWVIILRLRDDNMASCLMADTRYRNAVGGLDLLATYRFM